MGLNNIQKLLLSLILLSGIIFIFELNSSSAQPQKNNEIQQIAVPELQEQEPLNNSTAPVNNETKIDYGQPIIVPDDFFNDSKNATIKSNISTSLNSTNETNKNESIELTENHDLGIEKIYTKNDTENPLKLIIKVKVKNYGDFKESKLYLRGTVGNKTRYYGPYNKTITRSKTITSQWTQKEPGAYNITFGILNYSNFNKDSNKENNIKSIKVYLTDNGTTN